MDVFLVPVSGESFERAIVERAFARVATDQAGDCWVVEAANGEASFARIYIEDEPEISGFSFDRPPSYAGIPGFWDALFEVMSRTRTFLIWGGGGGPNPDYCVANEEVIADLDADMLEEMGRPAIARSGAEIEAAMTRALEA